MRIRFFSQLRYIQRLIIIGSIFLLILFILTRQKTHVNHSQSLKFLPNPSNQSLDATSQFISVMVSAMESAGKLIMRIRRESNFQVEVKKKEQEQEEIVTVADRESEAILKSKLDHAYKNIVINSEEDQGMSEKLRFSSACENSDSDKLNQESFNVEKLSVLLDPLDATTEYTLNKLDEISVMACVFQCTEPVAGFIHFPNRNQTFWAWKAHSVSENMKDIASINHEKELTNPKIVISRTHQTAKTRKIAKSLFSEYDLRRSGGAGNKARAILLSQADIYLHASLIKVWDICAPAVIFSELGSPIYTLDGMPILPQLSEQIKISQGFVATMYSPSAETISKSIASDASLSMINEKNS